jgi:hypothetical protein
MKRIAFALLGVGLLAGCASEPELVKLPPADGAEPPVERIEREGPHARTKIKTYNMAELKAELGMNREVSDLGFADKDFDGCRTMYKGDEGECGARVLSVVNFRLVCRDTVGTTSRAPSSLTPLTSGHLEWRFAGARGHTRTDHQGYGQVQVVSNGPVGTQRFILIIGSKTVGVEASEINQIVLPKNFCTQHLAME